MATGIVKVILADKGGNKQKECIVQLVHGLKRQFGVGVEGSFLYQDGVLASYREDTGRSSRTFPDDVCTVTLKDAWEGQRGFFTEFVLAASNMFANGNLLQRLKQH